LVLPIIMAVSFNVGLMGEPVWAAGQILKETTIEKIGKDFMFDTLQWGKDRLEIKVVYEGKQIKLPLGDTTFDCKLPGRKRRVGRIHFMCLVKVTEDIKKRLHLYADVKI